MVFDVKRIGFALGAEQSVVHKILTGYGLFEFTDDNLHFWSARLLSQIKHRSKLMELRQEAGRKGGKARAKQDGSVAEANDKQLLGKSQPKESKGKESKGKESAVAVAIAPALTSIPEMEDVIRSFASSATSRGIDPAQVKIVTHAKNFLDHYGSQGWRKGNGMPITDWRLLVSRWLTTELGKRDPQNSPKPTRTWGQ
jgi:general stress protein YciG